MPHIVMRSLLRLRFSRRVPGGSLAQVIESEILAFVTRTFLLPSLFSENAQDLSFDKTLFNTERVTRREVRILKSFCRLKMSLNIQSFVVSERRSFQRCQGKQFFQMTFHA